MNGCLKIGYFPKQWRRSRVILIPKAGAKDKIGAEKYRPIAINSMLLKILEKLIKDRIYYYLSNQQLFPKHRYGFQHNTSTTDALMEIRKRIVQASLDKLGTLIISLDIKNAFNSIQPKIILKKLKAIKCYRNLIQAIEPIPTGRKIIYEDAVNYLEKELNAGSPQGSPLNSIYWNILIAEIFQLYIPEGTHIQAFAGIIIIIKIKSRQQAEKQANKTLQVLAGWGNKVGLEFNPEKSKFMMIEQEKGYRPPINKLKDKKIMEQNNSKYWE